jgi:glycosyltransferase involved in cell wall biosynthesis
MERKRILVMTDSPKLHTGFAGVGREIWTYLNRTGKYDIRCIGWFHQETNEEVTYPILLTEKDNQGRTTQEDKYAHKSLPMYIEKFKPDMVWTLGDMWMVDHVATVPSRKTFKWVAYFPIDGHPSPSKWGATVEDMDVAVAYGKYGMEVIKQRAPKANLKYIYHGVDSEVFKPVSKEERLEARKSMLGITDDKTKVLGVVARNQPRKAFDKLFEAYFYILNGMYVRCKKCNKVTVYPFNLVRKELYPVNICRHCGCTDVKKGEPRDDVRLYLHSAIVDCGWDLLDLQKDYNLVGKVLVNPKLKIGSGVSEYTLNGVYNAFDIFTLPTRGEGFGLPILEAMSAGIPVVVTDYSAHTEWVGRGGLLVPPVVLESEPMTNIRRAIIDIDLYVTCLLGMIDDPELRTKCGLAGREIAKTMDWKGTCAQWEKLIDEVLFPDGQVPDNVAPADAKYNLEGM